MIEDNYDDIINLPHPEPKNHRRMSMMARAAQFAPFAALTGHDDAIAETARLTDQQIELDGALNDELNEAFAQLQQCVSDHPVVEVTHFVPDARKQGGSYMTVTGAVKRLALDTQHLILADGTSIAIPAVISLKIK